METCLDRVHPEDLPRVKKVMAEAVRARQSFVCDHRVVLPDARNGSCKGAGKFL